MTAIAWAGHLHNASLSEAKTLDRNSSVKSDSNSVALIQLAPEDTNAPSEHISAEATRVPSSLGFRTDRMYPLSVSVAKMQGLNIISINTRMIID